MLKSLIALLLLAPSLATAQHWDDFLASQVELDAAIEAQSQNDARQDLYSDHIYSEVKKVKYQVQDIYGQLDRLDGAIAVNMANSSIVSTGQNGVSFGIGVGSYNSKNAVSSKLTYIETGFSFNVSAGISDNDSTPVYGAGLNYTF